MTASILLSLSAICIQGYHSYLLFTQRTHRKWSISHHATLTRKTRFLYILSHIVGGLLWWVAANMLFAANYPLLLITSTLMVLFQWLQAITIQDADIDSIHFKLAYFMWTFAELTALIGTVMLPLPVPAIIIASTLSFAIVGLSAFMFFNKDSKRFYIYQYIVIWCLFGVMAVFAISLS